MKLCRIFFLFFWILLLILTLEPSFSAANRHFCLSPLSSAATPEKAQFIRFKKQLNALTLKAELEDDRSEFSSSGDFSERKSLIFSEALRMNYRGSFYHPKFSDFSLYIELIPQQHREQSEFETSGKFRNDFLTDFRFLSTFLKDKPYPVTVFADKQDHVRHADVYKTQTVDSLNFGSTFHYLNPKFPLLLSYQNSDSEVESTFRNLLRYHDERLVFRAENKESEFWGKWYFDYVQNEFDQEETDVYENQGTYHILSLENIRAFDPAHDNVLNSNLRTYSLTGDRESEQLSVDEVLTLTHTDHFKTHYSYDYNERLTRNVDFKAHRVGAGLQHQLYESLTSFVDVAGTVSESTDFDQKIGEVSIEERYKKNIGFAIFRAETGFSLEKSRRVSEGSLSVLREPYRLTDNLVEFLKETGIDPESVSVLNKDGLLLVKDKDYQIVSSSGKVELRRLPESLVFSGEEVFVDYIVENPVLDYLAFQKYFRVSLSSLDDKLRIYDMLRTREYMEVEGGEGFATNDFTDNVLGVSWRWKMFVSGAEYENYDANLAPFRGFRLWENVRWDISSSSSFSLNASYSDMDFLQEEDHRKDYTLSGLYYFRLSPKTFIDVSGGYRFQQGARIDLEDLIGKVSFKTKIKKLDCEISYEYEDRRYNESERVNHYGYIKFTRYF